MEYYKAIPNNWKNTVHSKSKEDKSCSRLSRKKEKKEKLSRKKLNKVLKHHTRENLDLGIQTPGKEQFARDAFNRQYKDDHRFFNFNYITQSKRIDDVEPVFGFNAVASYGPVNAGLLALQLAKPKSILKHAPKKMEKGQVRFSDRLLCRQFVRVDGEKELERINYKRDNGLMSKLSKIAKKKMKSAQSSIINHDNKVSWYLESEYSLSNVSGLYPEEIAAIKAYQTFCMPNERPILSQRNLASSPIPEEDELVTNSSVTSGSLVNFDLNSYGEDCVLDPGIKPEKSSSLESLPANSIDSGYDRSTEASFENLKLSNPCVNAKISLIDGLFKRAQTSAELKVAESLRRMNLPDWAIKGLYISQDPSEEKIASVMSKSDNWDLMKALTRSDLDGQSVKTFSSNENISILPRFVHSKF